MISERGLKELEIIQKKGKRVVRQSADIQAYEMTAEKVREGPLELRISTPRAAASPAAGWR
jgi:hypothetical protein